MIRAFVVFVLMILGGVAAGPSLAAAGSASGNAAISSPASSSPCGGEERVFMDTWAGGVAAVGCGLFVRYTIYTGGTQVGTIAGAVACCAYMLLDGFFFND